MQQTGMNMSNFQQLPTTMIVLGIMGLAPFMAVMVTSFTKLVVVLGLVRNALGTQQSPPNMVINGLSIILTLYIMAPVGSKMAEIAARDEAKLSSPAGLAKNLGPLMEPLRKFMEKHANPRERTFFMKSAAAIWPKDMAAQVKDNDLLVLIPAFTVSELTSAFAIGFFIYLPFIVIDLVVSNILMAMGMMMVSPMTISLPIKLLLFVLIDGWARLTHSLILSYG
ncbi:MAG TPA: type III secretion system export apparatus subunit SctR [Fibrobacteria bacterium]|nr:type III secretion system export apparatus subunit SctR [Fibrobacteria bacterium]